MGTLYLVRHGQASFGAANYDQLSPLGQRQAVRLGQHLGEHLARQGQRWGAVLTGTLVRHAQTWAGMAQGAGWQDTPMAWPELNEYDSEALIRTLHPEPLPAADTPEKYRAHFRLLRQALQAWMAGDTAPEGMPSYAQFAQGIARALDHVRQCYPAPVLVVSSGGPISTAVGQVLGVPSATTIELNLRMRNTALSELAYTPKRHMLVTYNTLPHLQDPACADWVTYA